MNHLLSLITTDEQRMKIVAELLSNGLIELMEHAMKNHLYSGIVEFDDEQDARENLNLLRRVIDAYSHPESYAIEESEK